MRYKRRKCFLSYLFGKYSKKILFCSIFIAGLFFNSWELHAQEHIDLDVEVLEAVWTNGIDARENYTKKVELHSLNGPLYFCLRLKGKKKALEYMEVKGKIPIQVHWFRTYGGIVFKTDVVDISIDKKNLKALSREFRNRGFFDWQTHSFKKNIFSGSYMVKIFYKEKSPILCQKGTRKEACLFKIDVN